MFKKIALAAALGAVAFSPAANAGTATGVLNVTATVTGSCTIVTPATLAFGNIVSTLTVPAPGTATLSVNCTSSLPYDVGIDATGGSAGTNRRMSDGAASPSFLLYQLYSDAARTTIWGNTVGTSTVPGTGTGAAQPITVYGSVLVQNPTPPAGAYTDTLNVTVTF